MCIYTAGVEEGSYNTCISARIHRLATGQSPAGHWPAQCLSLSYCTSYCNSSVSLLVSSFFQCTVCVAMNNNYTRVLRCYDHKERRTATLLHFYFIIIEKHTTLPVGRPMEVR